MFLVRVIENDGSDWVRTFADDDAAVVYVAQMEAMLPPPSDVLLEGSAQA